MREVEFLHATRRQWPDELSRGLAARSGTGWHLAAADGQMGCLMKLYRDWQLCGDDAMLRRSGRWRAARWNFAGFPAAGMPTVMASWKAASTTRWMWNITARIRRWAVWYLGALRACEEMARYLGEDDFAANVPRPFRAGQRWMDAQSLQRRVLRARDSPADQSAADIAPGLRHEAMGSRKTSPIRILQLGAGCLVDQLVGQYMAHVCGLGYLLDQQHVRTTLQSLMKYNFKETLCRALQPHADLRAGDEAAMLMATYPQGRRPTRPFPYFNEVMTGFEYTAAIHML